VLLGELFDEVRLEIFIGKSAVSYHKFERYGLGAYLNRFRIFFTRFFPAASLATAAVKEQQ
jgi:hypothetical protein